LVAVVAVVAEVAVVALPERLPITLPTTLPVTLTVILFAEKLPELSLRTRAPAVLLAVAPFAKSAPEATSAAVWPPTVATTVLV